MRKSRAAFLRLQKLKRRNEHTARNKTIDEKIAAAKKEKEQYEMQMKALEQQPKVQNGLML